MVQDLRRHVRQAYDVSKDGWKRGWAAIARIEGAVDRAVPIPRVVVRLVVRTVAVVVVLWACLSAIALPAAWVYLLYDAIKCAIEGTGPCY